MLAPASQEDIDEVEKYKNFKIGDDYNKRELLSWWSRNTHHFPTISKLANYVLAVPAISVPSEELFNTVGDLYTKKRACLQATKGEKVLFVNKNPH